MKKYRILENGRVIDVQAKSLESLVRRRYGRTARIHYGDSNSPYFTITRTDKFGHHIMAKVEEKE